MGTVDHEAPGANKTPLPRETFPPLMKIYRSRVIAALFEALLSAATIWLTTKGFTTVDGVRCSLLYMLLPHARDSPRVRRDWLRYPHDQGSRTVLADVCL